MCAPTQDKHNAFPPIAGIVPRLDPIPDSLKEGAWEALSKGNFRHFLLAAPSDTRLWLVWENTRLLVTLGIYEPALLIAYTDGRVNWWDWSSKELNILFHIANREKMRAAGDPLPGPGPFTLYRGVSGSRRVRRVSGFSWTASFEQAQWFSERFATLAPDPAVYRLVVPQVAVLAYTNERKEEEFIVEVFPWLRPVKCT
jgi:hypothetical protein